MSVIIFLVIYFICLIISTSFFTLIFKPTFVPAMEFFELTSTQFWSTLGAFVLTILVYRIGNMLRFKVLESPIDGPPDFYKSIHFRKAQKLKENPSSFDDDKLMP